MTYYRPPLQQAMVISTALMLPLFVLPVGIYCLVHDAEAAIGFAAFNSIPAGVSLLAGIGVHELLHGLGFHVFGGIARSNIKFGVMWKYLTPYAAALTPITMKAYRIAGALPGVALGVVPAIVAIALGLPVLLSFAAIMLAAAAGDLYILLQSRNVDGNSLVLDSPDSLGFDVVMASYEHE